MQREATGHGVVRRAPRAAAALVAVAAMVGVSIVSAVGDPPALAADGDGVLTVEVNRDFSGDGVYDSGFDPGQAGVAVTVTDGDSTVGPVVTDAAGQAQFDLTEFAGSRFRVDVEITDAALDHLTFAPAAPAGTDNAFRSATTFVDGATQTIHVGVWNPNTYVPENPPVAVIQQVERSAPADMRSIMITDWDNRGPATMSAESNTDGLTTVATQAETGSVFGSAWNHRTDSLYTAAYAKSHTNYGPGGNGAIYVTDTQAAAPGNTTVWATVPNAGTAVHQTDLGMGYDDPFYFANGREGLGGLALSEDGSTLYAVNLNDRSLYSFDTSATAPAPVADVVPIATDACSPSGEWRPFAVAVRDGEVYVGGVCDASYTLDRSDLSVHVLRLDGASFAPVFSHVLDAERGANNYADPVGNLTGPGVSTHWNPWRNAWDADLSEYLSRAPLYPTPMLTTLAFENDGSLILGLRDRNSDAVVVSGFSPDPGNRVLLAGQIVGGDINKVCLTDGVFEWEGTGSCADNSTPENSGGEPADRVEFFPGDFLDSTVRYGDETSVRHYENSMGGVLLSPREADVANTTMDPTGLYNTGGIGFYDRMDGTGPGNEPLERGLIVAGNEAINFGKANGLGSLSLLADYAPLQIGNLVWFDADNDGEQDAAENEPGIPGATVRLLSADGSTVLATTTTDENGEYYFGGEGGFPLDPETEYIVEFDLTEIDAGALPGAPDADQLEFTRTQDPDAGTIHDSNPTASEDSPLIGRASVVTPAVGGVDHTIDAGIWLRAGGIDIVKFDDRADRPDNPVDGPDAVDGEYGGPTPGEWPEEVDADTESTAVAYPLEGASTGPQPVGMIVTNTGARDLTDVSVADLTLAGSDIADITCDFSPLGGPETGTEWSGPFAPGDEFTCVGMLEMGAGELHHNVASVTAQPVDDNGADIGDVIGDEDPYWAQTPALEPALSITKRDAASGAEADTAGDAIEPNAGEKVRVEMPVSNTGDAELAEVVVRDTTDDGPDMAEFMCTFPDGSLALAEDGEVRWAATHGGGDVRWLPGETFTCTGVVTLEAGQTHANTATVLAVAPDGTTLTDNDPFHVRVPAETGLATTGGTDSSGAVLWATGLIVAGLLLTVPLVLRRGARAPGTVNARV